MQIYIDDLLIAMRGRPEERCKLLSMFLCTMRALGIMISLEKRKGHEGDLDWRTVRGV